MASEFVRLDCIGSGSFGKVWLVRYSANGRSYVLKEVQVRGLTDKEIDQAVCEVKILSHLGHFNIIRYKQAFIEDQSLNIIMEYADGGDMHSKIQAADSQYFDERQVINWFIQIAFALKYIHKENILHRDLKTQNIFITKENVIKVGDFGIAKVLLSDSGKADTAIGTPYYLSPEICQSKSYNKKSDIWALGCVLYEMATLKHAFESATFNNLIMKIVHGEHGKLPYHYPFNPLSSLIEMMLQHEADDRPSADQLLRLPILRPHIAKYEQMALKLIEAKQAKKTGSPGVRRGRKHSLSEDPDSKKASSPIVTKKRSQSVDSGMRRKNDLRRSVILRQALTRHSSVNSSTYNISPVSSLTSSDTNSSKSITTPPNTPVTSSGGSTIEIQDVSDYDDILDVYASVLLSAHKGDKEVAISDIHETIRKKLGDTEAEKLATAVSNHMDQSLDDSSVFFPASELQEVGSGVKTELLLMSMLKWYLHKQSAS